MDIVLPQPPVPFEGRVVTDRTPRQAQLVELFTEICAVLATEDSESFIAGHEVELTVLGTWPQRVVLCIGGDGHLDWKVIPDYYTEADDDG